jgi:LPS-assembly lipoprotein
MLLSDRRAFLLAAFALTGCGFAPVHGSNSKSQIVRNAVLVQAPKNRAEFELVRNLEVLLGPATAKRYDLSYTLTVDEQVIVVSAAQEINRFSLIGVLNFSLVDADGEVFLSKTVKSFTGYSATGTTVATERSKRDAYNRLMVILAKQVSNHLWAVGRA